MYWTEFDCCTTRILIIQFNSIKTAMVRQEEAQDDCPDYQLEGNKTVLMATRIIHISHFLPIRGGINI